MDESKEERKKGKFKSTRKNRFKRPGDAKPCCRCDVLSTVPVRIVEYLPDLEALGRLGEADHVVGGADLDEGEPGHLG